MKIPTDPDEILALLSELSASVYDGLTVGTLDVRHYFSGLSKEMGKPVEINRPIATNHVRYRTKMHVVENRKIGAPYHIEEIAYNGISIRYDWCHVKVYKTLDSEPPTAHNTEKNKRFYRQQKLPHIAWTRQWQHDDWAEVAPTLDIANLIYGWEVDTSYNIIQVQLFCPRVSGKYRQGVRLFWRREILHPILGITGIPTVNDAQDVDDLPVYFEDAANQGDDD